MHAYAAYRTLMWIKLAVENGLDGHDQDFGVGVSEVASKSEMRG